MAKPSIEFSRRHRLFRIPRGVPCFELTYAFSSKLRFECAANQRRASRFPCTGKPIDCFQQVRINGHLYRFHGNAIVWIPVHILVHILFPGKNLPCNLKIGATAPS